MGWVRLSFIITMQKLGQKINLGNIIHFYKNIWSLCKDVANFPQIEHVAKIYVANEPCGEISCGENSVWRMICGEFFVANHPRAAIIHSYYFNNRNKERNLTIYLVI